MDALAREYHDTHDPEIPEEIYRLARQLKRVGSLKYVPKGVSQNPQRPLFHLLCLCGGFVEPRLEVRPTVFPRHLDGGFHVVCQNDKLRRSAVVIRAEAHDVYLSHSLDSLNLDD